MDQLPEPKFGPIGRDVWQRTYQRSLPNGTKEEWEDTCWRVVRGNLGLVYGDETTWTMEVSQEASELFMSIYAMAILPAGRHLFSAYQPGQTFLSNCHNADWTDKLSDHVVFAFMRLAEGGGVGSNVSAARRPVYAAPRKKLELHFVALPEHADHDSMREAGVLSDEFSDEWVGAYEVEDSREGWGAALADLIDTFYRDAKHAKRVYSLSHIRPAGARLKRFGGSASGPLPFAQMMHEVAHVLNERAHVGGVLSGLELMRIDHSVAQAVVAGGVRRSARMVVMAWDDLEIFRFIRCKEDPMSHWSCNISCAIDSAYLKGLADPTSLASKVHAAIVAGMLQSGEPGIWHEELSNVGEVRRVASPNPCMEILLEPFEACTIGSINMEAFVPRAGREVEAAKALASAHRLLVRFLIRATFGDYADPKQKEVQQRNRRIGVGHLGVQPYLNLCGMRYSEACDSESYPQLLRGLYRVCRDEAHRYAFELRIPEPLKLAAIAPNGTVSQLPGTTPGIHAIFGKHFIRRVRFSTTDPDQIAQVAALVAEGYETEPDLYSANTVVVSYPTRERLLDKVAQRGYPTDIVESLDELTVEQQLAFASMYQTDFTDNAVSLTVTIDPATVSPQYLAQALQRWLPTLKGVSCFPEMSRPQSPYERITEDQFNEMTSPKQIGGSNDPDCVGGSCPVR